MTPVEIARGIWRIADTCAVYLIIDPDKPSGERDAIAIDFGSGRALDHLAELGIRSLTDVLMTHHHRDQGQGLPRAVAIGARIHVPPVEVELFEQVELMWEGRQLDNDYNLRQDRFSLLESVPVHATVPEYRALVFEAATLRVLPAPGHTIGSVAYLLERDGERIAFTGDLIYAPGKVWSLAATQWSYRFNEGPAMTVLSCILLEREKPSMLAPSHGDVIRDAQAALARLADAMQDYVDRRSAEPCNLADLLDHPFVTLAPHLLLNRTSMSSSYVLLSDTGEALVVDYGYDMSTGIAPGQERAARRPWLASLAALRRDHGVTKITVALPTHYHDDHVAGMPLLRDVEGTQLWVPENVAPTMANPWREDLPCQWYDPIVADRVLALDAPFRWNEYEFTAHALPGHTLYAVAYSLVVDGITVAFTGDQTERLDDPDSHRDITNYQYRNLFRLGDYTRSAALFQRIAPGLIASGHWDPRWTDAAYFDSLVQLGQETDAVHRGLLPLDDISIGPDGQTARIVPYRAQARCGETLNFAVRVRNPLPAEAAVRLSVVVPPDWQSSEHEFVTRLASGDDVTIEFSVVAATPGRRQRMAVDVTIGELLLGQHAEALVDVVAVDADAAAPTAGAARTDRPDEDGPATPTAQQRASPRRSR
ncbi:MBL fold metallo-hydrolase [Agromyces sp. CFH 90414]|uniref:MBL fold metallo-hydrolase n=1 Tax=Agromyces agglutinans TaxID=2662258 RepID=A0A6I2F058_9MICO|nr:MBL fold metallo-hydrolase [Agromyces agglutinans]MRG58775.1 MBL fold metallo-hydrolase [Agromyces agglutinans]